MKDVVIVLGGLLAARPADACGVPDFGAILVDVAKAFDPKTEPVHTPLVTIGGGATTAGNSGSLLVGYGWGERDRGGLFPGSALTRVMVGTRHAPDASAVSLTLGWYQTQVGSAGFDFGVEHDFADGATGPIARLTLGVSGIAARLGGGFMFGGGDTRLAGQAEIVIEVLDLVDRI